MIVLAVRSVPNKLLLGLLVAITAVAFTAILPSAGRLAIALMIPAIALILVGAIYLAIDFVAKLVISDNKIHPKNQPINQRLQNRLQATAKQISIIDPLQGYYVTL